MPSLSMTMLVYNEVEYLSVLKDVYFDCFDELVFVDMGSTDGSLDIIAGCPANRTRLVTMDRRDLLLQGFAHARNVGIAAATSEWIFAIDADELILPAEIDHLRAFLSKCPFRACSVGRRNYTAVQDLRISQWSDIMNQAAFTNERHIRIHRRDASVKWKGIIHEEIFVDDRSAHFDFAQTEIELHHLSAFRKERRDNEKGGQYAWMTLHAFVNPDLRMGTNEWWFSTYVPQHYPALVSMASTFARCFDLPMVSVAKIERVIGEDQLRGTDG